MRRSVTACSLLALTFTLTACDGSGNKDSSASEESQQTIKWDDRTVEQLRKAIGARTAHGLDRMQFALQGNTGNQTGQDALTGTALRYATALASGASDPTKLNEIYTLPRPRPDLRSGLAKALSDHKLAEWLASLAPSDENYGKLSEAYLALRRQGAAPASPIPQIIEPILPGKSDPRIQAIAKRLIEAEYLSASAPYGNTYGPNIVAAVKRLQTDYGIDPDGAIGGDTAAILELSDTDRAAALAVAMERMRWMDRKPPATRIDVNLAAARLNYWRDGKIADTRKVVVGKPETATPQLGSPIYRLVANPTWTIPRSIQNKEISRKGTGYLKRNNMVWKNGWIVQQPGPKNSLGLVKFDMKNDHEIYLHDTPAKQLFAEVQRQRSHGCVRVDDAVGFAGILAKDEGILEEWNKARATGKETFVSLPREIPVRLYYQTVQFDASGAPVIRADPYAWNDRVATALGFPAQKSTQLRSTDVDDGP